MSDCEVSRLGRIEFAAAWDLQRDLVERRKRNEIPDQLLFVEHPHTITQGRNSRPENLLASAAELSRAGVALVECNRGGDVTYHGPGQVLGYPILDLRNWKRDVVAYVRELEQVIIQTLDTFSVSADRLDGMTGVWVDGRKVAAIGIHISRWITSHGFALNVSTDLSYFRYIVPCGLTLPVTSLRELGCGASEEDIMSELTLRFMRAFRLTAVQHELLQPAL